MNMFDKLFRQKKTQSFEGNRLEWLILFIESESKGGSAKKNRKFFIPTNI